MKRVIAEVTDEFFWELKQKTAQTQLKQKTIIILSIHKLMQMETPLVDLIDSEEYARLVALEMVEV